MPRHERGPDRRPLLQIACGTAAVRAVPGAGFCSRRGAGTDQAGPVMQPPSPSRGRQWRRRPPPGGPPGRCWRRPCRCCRAALRRCLSTGGGCTRWPWRPGRSHSRCGSVTPGRRAPFCRSCLLRETSADGRVVPPPPAGGIRRSRVSPQTERQALLMGQEGDHDSREESMMWCGRRGSCRRCVRRPAGKGQPPHVPTT